MQQWQAREAVVEIGRRLWQRGYVAANDGNISVRLEDDRLLATPTGVSKGFMEPGMLILCDLEGRVIQGEHKPSSELKMHLLAYRMRPDVGAVVHAHPPVATAFSTAGVPLDKCVLPESVLTLGAIPIAPYATPSTDEIPESLEPFVLRCDAVLLANHGAVTWAGDLTTAYYRMETLEHTATITRNAMLLGNVNLLGADDVQKLQQVRQQMGIPGQALACRTANGPQPEASASDERERIIQAVTREVLSKLARR